MLLPQPPEPVVTPRSRRAPLHWPIVGGWPRAMGRIVGPERPGWTWRSDQAGEPHAVGGCSCCCAAWPCSAAGQGVGARWCGDGQVLLETPQCGLGVRHDSTTAVSPLASARVSRTRRRGHAHRASAGARATTRALRTAHCYAHRDCF